MCQGDIYRDANFYPWMGGGEFNKYLSSEKLLFYFFTSYVFFRDTVVQASQDLSFAVAVPATLTSSLEQVSSITLTSSLEQVSRRLQPPLPPV